MEIPKAAAKKWATKNDNIQRLADIIYNVILTVTIKTRKLSQGK
jgi:hypothetical protein